MMVSTEIISLSQRREASNDALPRGRSRSVVLVKLAGSVETLNDVAEPLMNLVREGHHLFAVDFAQVKTFGGQAAAALVALRQRLRPVGGHVVLFALPVPVRVAFKAAEITEFQIVSSAEIAFEHLAARDHHRLSHVARVLRQLLAISDEARPMLGRSHEHGGVATAAAQLLRQAAKTRPPSNTHQIV